MAFTITGSTNISGSWTMACSPITPVTYNVQYLVVGGGGSGGMAQSGNDTGGGGGAGQVLTGNLTLTSGTCYSITIGAGGISANGTSGSNSVISGTPITTVTATGGGAGGGGYAGGPITHSAGLPGGSGGGGWGSGLPGSSPSAFGTATGSPGAYGVTGTGGYPGGNGMGPSGGGGGGGAGGAGGIVPPAGLSGGAGGAGYTWSVTGLTYGGGGGGSGTTPVAGGPGGGGASGVAPGTGTVGTPGTPGLGGGGGGGYAGTGPNGVRFNGGCGGSGTVILVVPTSSYPGYAQGATVTTPPAVPGMTVLTYTSSTPTTPQTFTYSTGPAGYITATAGATTTVRAVQNQAITSFSPFSSVTNGITPYYYYVSSGTLPAGITINSSTGLVSGTPTNTYSSANVTFSVVDAYSTLATTTATVNFTVNAIITATAGATTTVSGAQTVAISSFNPFSSVTDGYTPYVYGIVSGTLPTGITLDTSTGLVSGTPSAAYSSANVVFKVTDNLGIIASTTVTVNFTIVGIITATAGATTTVRAIQNSAITSFNPFSSVSNGTTPYTYFVSSGTLPSGITLNPSTGLVSGTPTATQTASSVTFSVRDANNITASTTSTVSFTVNVALSATAGATTTVTGEQTLAITGFNTFSSVTGGYTPYVYGTVSGTLPTGITLNTGNGFVSGTPSVASSATVVFKVTDNLSTIAGTTATVSFSIATRISAVAGVTTSVFAQQNTAITNFNPFSSVSNGVGAYTYYVSSGTLPTGVTLNASTGQVSGTPTATQVASNVIFAVRDSLNVSAATTVTVAFTVRAGISAVAGATTTVSAVQSTAITSFNAFTSVSNGYTPYVYSVSSGTLPSGITLNSSTGLISGTPTATYATASVTLRVTDAQGYVAATTTTVSFTVNATITATAGATTTVSVAQNTAITSFNPFASVSGGYPPYTYYTSSGTLPTGITLNTSTGLVSGTPTVIQAASNVVFRVRDSQSTSAATTVTVSFTVTTPPPSPYTVNYLVVAGGGGGGGGGGPPGGPGQTSNSATGGGGGGGGVRAGCLAVDPTTGYPVVIGSGGTGGLDSTPNPALPGAATAGGSSTFSTITSTGGGAGAGYIYYPFAPNPGTFRRCGSSGGSGGGATAVGVPTLGPPTGYFGYSAPPGSPGTPGQGNPGGISGGTSGVGSVNLAGGMGGGGGAGAAGGNGGTGNPAPTGNQRGGPGGAGYTWPVNGVIYGGGGGGSGRCQPSPAPAGNGGPGGGGTGGWGPKGVNSSGSPGTTNRGGGGGGGSCNPGGAGGPGIVLISYTNPTQRGTGGTVTHPSPTLWIHTFTAPGTYTAG